MPKTKVAVSGVILAAGGSSRLGRPKQLLAYKGRPLLDHVVQNALSSNLGEIIVVLGAERGRVRVLMDLSKVHVVENEQFAKGQSTSVVVALDNVDQGAAGVLILLGDQPGVSADVINAVVAAFDGDPQTIVMPSWRGTPANPVLFGRAYFSELRQLTGDEGARDLVKQASDHVCLVPIDQPVPQDVDTEADYQHLIESAPPKL
jgi:molybdenum cofactor cytidylyltransferase